jgi:hypothetical protein
MFKLDYGNIVRLKHNPDFGYLQAGDCGIIWACYYIFEPIVYEASFCNCQGEDFDHMFTADEVDLLLSFDETPFPRHLQAVLQGFDRANEILKNGGRHLGKD